MQINPTGRIFDDIYQRPEEVRFWLGQNPGKAFLRAMREWRTEYESQLRKSDVATTLHRAQGAIEVLDRIIQLKDELQLPEVKDVNQFKGGSQNVVGS